MKVHGNYCGPGWTAGKYMDAKDATENDFKVDPVDKMDRVCKYHDYMIWNAWKERDERVRRKMLKKADRIFYREMIKLAMPGMKDDMMAFAVWAGGPGPNVRIGKSFFNLQ
jgi:hypothetical protein